MIIIIIMIIMIIMIIIIIGGSDYQFRNMAVVCYIKWCLYLHHVDSLRN